MAVCEGRARWPPNPNATLWAPGNLEDPGDALSSYPFYGYRQMVQFSNTNCARTEKTSTRRLIMRVHRTGMRTTDRRIALVNQPGG